ncbi:hypothetical protein TI05_16260 [Achromatium sp. WMS3]|nr:hypothetical protein TI05_16260 [Achromatium sp. WMS3]
MKDKEIFLDTSTGNSPKKHYKHIKIVFSEISVDLLGYYDGKWEKKLENLRIKGGDLKQLPPNSAGKFLKLFARKGMTEYVYQQFIYMPIPEQNESKQIDKILHQLLTSQEPFEYKKGRIGTIKYYYDPNSQQYGISKDSIAIICGGVNDIDAIINQHFTPQNIYIPNTQGLVILKAENSHQIIQFYAYKHSPKKLKAKSYLKTLHSTLAEHISTKITLPDDIEKLPILQKIEQLKINNAALKAENLALVKQLNKFTKEQTFQEHLANVFQGVQHYYIDGPFPGYADIVNDHFVIEIKNIEKLDAGFGQIMRYKKLFHDNPKENHHNRKFLLALFGEVTEVQKQFITELVEPCEIAVLFYEKLPDSLPINSKIELQQKHFNILSV